MHYEHTPPQPPLENLPSYATLAYLEKLGLVLLTAIALVFLVGRTLHAGPVQAIRDLGGLKR